MGNNISNNISNIKNNNLPQLQRNDQKEIKSDDQFKNLLENKLNLKNVEKKLPIQSDLIFSKHAVERIRDRGISMQAEQVRKLEKAVDAASEKGSREALILMDDTAFIVSISNKTVITALDKESSKGNIFTNIDSTIMI